LGVTPSDFRRDLWRQKTSVPRLSYGVLSVILHLAIFGTVPASDIQMDRQKCNDSTHCAGIALHVKNHTVTTPSHTHTFNNEVNDKLTSPERPILVQP